MDLREFNLARDYDATLALWQTAAPGVHVGRSDSAAEIAKKLERDPDLFLVADEGGAIVGSVIGGYDGRRGLVYHLAVAPDWRGRGLGRQLMAELESRLRARGCLKAYLLVTPDNAEALEFYARQGWEEMPLHLPPHAQQDDRSMASWRKRTRSFDQLSQLRWQHEMPMGQRKLC